MSGGGPTFDEIVEAARFDDDACGDTVGTRARVLESIGRRRHRRQVLTTLAMVVCLGAVGTTSWAWVSGWLPARLGRGEQGPKPSDVAALEPARRGVEISTTSPTPDVAAPAVAPPSSIADAAPAVAPPVVSTQQVVTPAAPGAKGKRPRRAIASSANRTVAPPFAELSPAAADPELVAFRRAHEAHFGGGAPADVLALWDAYLAAFARGRLAPEARFNRAVLLVKLGRAAEARQALAPFVDGTEGGYRRDEAARLVETLTSSQ